MNYCRFQPGMQKLLFHKIYDNVMKFPTIWWILVNFTNFHLISPFRLPRARTSENSNEFQWFWQGIFTIFLEIQKISRNMKNLWNSLIFLRELWKFNTKSTFSPDGEKTSISNGLLVFLSSTMMKTLIFMYFAKFHGNRIFYENPKF